MCAQMLTHVPACIHSLNMPTCTHLYIHIHTRACTSTRTHTCPHTCPPACMRAHPHASIHGHAYMHIHMQGTHAEHVHTCNAYPHAYACAPPTCLMQCANTHVHTHIHMPNMSTHTLAHPPMRTPQCARSHVHSRISAYLHTQHTTRPTNHAAPQVAQEAGPSPAAARWSRAHLQIQKQTVTLQHQDAEELAAHAPPGLEALAEGEAGSDRGLCVTATHRGPVTHVCHPHAVTRLLPCSQWDWSHLTRVSRPHSRGLSQGTRTPHDGLSARPSRPATQSAGGRRGHGAERGPPPNAAAWASPPRCPCT